MNLSSHFFTRLSVGFALVALSALLVTGCGKPEDHSIYSLEYEAPGPTKFKCSIVASIDTKLNPLRGIAVDKSGRIFAVGTGGLNILDDKGTLLKHIDRKEDLRCVTVADDGIIYLGAPGRIIKLDPAGVELASWTTLGPNGPNLGQITSLAVRGVDLLAADFDSRCIHRLTTSGEFSNNIGGANPGTPDGGLIVPSPHLDCAFNPAGDVVINHSGRLCVETYSLKGELLSTFGEIGMKADQFCGCCNPTDIAVAADGNVVTAEKGIRRVKLYDTAGTMLAYIAPDTFSDKEKELGLDLAVDPSGRILVADPGDSTIRIFALSLSNSKK